MQNSCYSCKIPADMVEVPHMIHFAGQLMQPGKEQDYTIEFINGEAILHWWDPIICDVEEKLISITKLNTGERWAYSSIEGIYVDTRKK